MKVVPAVAYAIGAVVTLIVAMQLAVFFESESCLDAGGSFNYDTGACDVDRPDYIAQFSRPDLYGFWALFLGFSFLPGWLSYRLVLLLQPKRES